MTEDEITRLRAEVAALKADLIAEQGYRAAAEEIAQRRGEMVERLTAERDTERETKEAAGREILEAASKSRSLRADLAQRTAERDEARRSACGFKARYMDSRIGFSPMTDDEANTEARKIAARMGWDCFEEVK